MGLYPRRKTDRSCPGVPDSVRPESPAEGVGKLLLAEKYITL